MPPPEDTMGRWSAATRFPAPDIPVFDGFGRGPLTDRRGLFVLHAVLLKTGKVLCFSGHAEFAFYPPTSYVFDPEHPAAALVPHDFPSGMDLFCCHYVQLRDGRILVVGGSEKDFQHHASTGATNVAIFDPDTNSWSEAMTGGVKNKLKQGRWYPTVVLLPDERVFIASGRPDNDHFTMSHRISNMVEILTGPDWGTTELAGATMDLPIYPGLHLAPNGRIYFTHTTWGQEMADPETMSIEVSAGATSASWTPYAGNRPAQPRREEGMSVMLPLIPPNYEGKILLVGGTQAETAAGAAIAPALGVGGFRRIHASTDPFSAEILDTTPVHPNPPTWSAAPGAPMSFGRTNGHCVLLPDATVLICGGHDGYKWQATTGSPTGTHPSLDAEIFTPGVGFTTVAAMHTPRMYHSVALLLPDGRVICAGGADPNQGEPYPDLGAVPPWPAHWGEDPAQPVGRFPRTYSTRVDDPGSPLGYAGMALNDKTFEFYEPPYCFNGARPTITGITRNGTSVWRIEYGQEFKVQTPQAASIDRVALMRPNAPTHHTDTEQRYVQLSFTKQANELTVTAVNDKKVAPPGYYMLWIVATGLPHGLPCEKAEFIRLVPSGTSCVVATATLGSPDHPSVEYLRELRRQISETTATGNGFIRIVNRVYESFSPRLANYLQQAPLARSAVRDVVVRPTVGIVKATQQITSPLPPTLREAALISLLAVEGLLGAAATPLLFTLVVARIIAGKLLGERYA